MQNTAHQSWKERASPKKIEVKPMQIVKDKIQ